MRQVEIQAYSVEEAVRLALEQLGRTRDQVNVEVLATDPGSEEVLVRVTARESLSGPRSAAMEAEASPRPQRGDQSRPDAGGMRPERDRMDRGDRGDRGNRRDRGDVGARTDRPERGRSGGDRFDRPPRQNGPNTRDGVYDNRTVPLDEGEVAEEDNAGNLLDANVNLDSSLETRPLAEGEHATPEDAVAPIAAEILQKILVRMKVRGRIVRRSLEEEGEAAFPDDEPSLVLNVTGLNERDQSTLIGRRGETLDALQFLVNLVLGRHTDLWTRVIVDVEGYRLRRKLALINLARRTAEQVQSRNQAIPLEAMPPYERRIIHMALSEHPAVFTESNGAEPDRRVIVLPK